MTRHQVSQLTKRLAVVAAVLLFLYGGSAVIFGRTPGGDASLGNRFSGLIMMFVSVLWMLPNAFLCRLRAPVLLVFVTFGCYGMYSLVRLISAGMWPEDAIDVKLWLLGLAVIPFLPVISLLLHDGLTVRQAGTHHD